jgi:hypothetical protein
MLLLYRPMFIKSKRKFSSLSIMFLFIGTRGGTEDIVDNGIGLYIVQGTKYSSFKRRVVSTLYCSRDSNSGCYIGKSYARVTGIF